MNDAAVITLEASELGFAPGSFPRVFEYQGKTYELSHPCNDLDDDLMYLEYHPRGEQYPSQIVRIFND